MTPEMLENTEDLILKNIKTAKEELEKLEKEEEIHKAHISEIQLLKNLYQAKINGYGESLKRIKGGRKNG